MKPDRNNLQAFRDSQREVERRLKINFTFNSEELYFIIEGLEAAKEFLNFDKQTKAQINKLIHKICKRVK